jgi:hypothetical protein
MHSYIVDTAVGDPVMEAYNKSGIIPSALNPNKVVSECLRLRLIDP